MPIKASISASKLMSPSKSYTKVVSDRYAALAKRAFLAWSSATDGTLIFDFVSNPADAQINCEWTNNLKERAHSFASGHCETILKGRSIWLAKQRALTYVGANLVASDMEFYNTCLHEIGHALGLNHSSHPEDVMYSGGRVTSAHAFAVLSKLDVYRVRKIYTYPFQSAQLALQYASAAFVDDDYDAAYKLLSETETKNKSLEQFQQALADQDHDPKPESLEIYRLYRDYHPGRITFILLARNHKTEQRYYFVQTVTMPDGVFRILDGGKISFKGSGVTQYDANRTSSGDERLVKHWEPE
jgi:hypothetical protein